MEVGSVYKLHHSMLPDNFPPQLAHIRAVMVGEKTNTKVHLSFPSAQSMEVFFGRDENGATRSSGWLMQPNLDSVYSMDVKLAETVLCDRVPFEEFAARRGTRSFWVNELSSEKFNGDGGDELPKWGLKKRASFVRKHREECETPVLAKDDAIKEDGAGKRKRMSYCKSTKYVKKKKKRGPVEISMSRKSGKFDVPVSETSFRWTRERYELAERSILKIMKAKGAFHGHPVLRADLRAEARKLIGDTGLLDHLLKHMAGKLAPGGKERFRRRHNPEGAMEYWLENADLVSIRNEAGIDDPYWIPPQGWKLGDSPTQDPVCARELRRLREDVDKMKSEIQEMVSVKGSDGEDGDCPASLDDVQRKGKSLAMPLKGMQQDLMGRKAKIEALLLNVSKALSDMEEDLGGIMVGVNSKKKVSADAAINEGASEICSSGGKEEKKAERRQRLKSGFTICKPDDTFLWPDMAAASFSAQLMIQVGDPFPLSSPPSVTSSKPPALPPPPPPPPPSPVFRPVANRPHLGISVYPLARGCSWSPEAKDKLGVASPTATSSSVFVPDLNEAPQDGDPTNLHLPSVPKSGFSNPIQGTLALNPIRGTMVQRAALPMNRASASNSKLACVDPIRTPSSAP